MSAQELRDLLERVEDTREVVLRRLEDRERAEPFVIWREARLEANSAYAAWRSHPGRDTYLAYRAAEDRADAAEDSLSRAVTGPREKVPA
jgi:hypothetical protein